MRGKNPTLYIFLRFLVFFYSNLAYTIMHASFQTSNHIYLINIASYVQVAIITVGKFGLSNIVGLLNRL